MSEWRLNVEANSMASPARLPGGIASQRRTRRAGTVQARINPSWRHGDRVRWGGQLGTFGHDLDDGIHAEIHIGHRLYRVRIADLRPG